MQWGYEKKDWETLIRFGNIESNDFPSNSVSEMEKEGLLEWAKSEREVKKWI